MAISVWRTAALRLIAESRDMYKLFFLNLVPVSCDGKNLCLGASDDFFISILENYYGISLERALQDIDGKDYTYTFVPGYEAPSVPFVALPAEEKTAVKTPAAEKVPAVKADEVTSTGNAGNAGESGHTRKRLNRTDYTFDNFIAGEENRHPFSVAQTAAVSPGTYNPILIYGTNGVGKTHLLHAVANAAKADNPNMVVRIATCDELINQFYDLIYQKESMTKFRESVRDVDMLLVDDIHRLAKRPQMQEEFFNLFNTLYDQGKQIVMTCDRQPCEMEDIDKRLTTRFEMGMISEVTMPEYEARLEILRLWRQEILTDHPLEEEFLDFLASNISSSVRRLRSCFLRLAAAEDLCGGDRLTLEKAENLIRVQLDAELSAGKINIEDILHSVADHFGCNVPDILKGGRKHSTVRIVAMALCRELTRLSTTEIGEDFGKTHATVINAEKRLPQLCKKNELLRRSVEQIKRNLKHHK